MRSNFWKQSRWLFVHLAIISQVQSPLKAQMGHVLDAVGPVNQSMGGAGVALPLDAMGSLHWNPASITGLEHSEIGFGFAALAPTTNLRSSVDAGSFGPGFPPVDLYGSTGSDQDINPIPTLGFVVQPKNSDWAYGLGGFAIGGFGVDYPTDPTNPILTPQPPIGMGFGSLYSQFQMMQFAPTVACRLTERVSVGTSVNFDWGTLAVSPFSAAFPDDANGNGFPTYPSGAAADARWGMGIQTGVYFDDPCTGWHLGMSYKSTQWFQEFKINSHDELGLPRQLQFDLDYPAILSFGTAYSGWERVSVAMDIRYIDYASTDGFALTGFGPDGAVQGFSWDSIWVVATGVQYELTDAVKLRAGYQFNESPIDSAAAFYNVLSPALVQHHLSCGFSATLPAEWIFSMAYHYGFEHSVSGPWYSPAGPIPGTEVKSSLATHILGGGISKQF